MKTKLRLITPIITKTTAPIDGIEALKRPDLEIEHTVLDNGPVSIEGAFDEAFCLPDLVKKAIEAEQSGFDAIIIDCMADPGLKACREAVSIPVLGAAETAMYIASLIGHKFSVIAVLDSLRPQFDDLVALYGLRDKYTSFSSIGVPVLELHDDLENVTMLLTQESIKQVQMNNTGAIILGCTGFIGCADAIRQGLINKNLDVPVIDPLPVGVLVADSLVKARLSHSKLTYPTPRVKEISGYVIPR